MVETIIHRYKLHKADVFNSFSIPLVIILLFSVYTTDAVNEHEEYDYPTSFTNSNATLAANAAYESLLVTMTTPEGIWRRKLEDSTEGDVPELYYRRAISIAIITLASMCVALALGSCFFVYKFRNNSIVAVGQPPFLYLICFGSILLSSSTYFTAFDEGNGRSVAHLNACCVASVWLVSCGNVIVYMALISKLWRVHKVTQFRRAQRVLVQHVIGPFVIILLSSIGILIAWTVKDPPRWEREIYYNLDGTVKGSWGVCNSDNGAYSASMNLLQLICIIIALWMSCKTRHVREDLSDSRRVCQTLCTQCLLNVLALIIGVVALILTSITTEQLTFFFVQILCALAPIGFLIFPKMFYVRYEQRTGHLPGGLNRIGGNIQVTGISVITHATVDAPVGSTASEWDEEIPTDSTREVKTIADNSAVESPT